MIWHKTDIYTIAITPGVDQRGDYFHATISWARKEERGPKVRSQERAVLWAAKQVCNRLGDAAVELAEKGGEEVLTW